MEFFAVFFVLLFLVVVVGSILGFVAMSRLGALDRDVKELRAAIRSLREDNIVLHTTENLPLRKLEPVTPTIKPDKINPASTPLKAKQVHLTAKPLRVNAKAKRRWEEEFGARWTVWVGGIALAFGAVFLLRYAAEAGIFTPGMRIGVAAMMGIATLGVGEVLRRVDPSDGRVPDVAKSAIDNAYIPGILTAVGIFTLLGSVYAAHSIYGLIPPMIAFTLLGFVSMCGLGLGLIHGPRMSALGLLAALVTPLLVHTGAPQYAVLFSYLIIVGTAATVLAYKRNWPWLILGAFGGLLAWATLTLENATLSTAYPAWAVYMSIIYGGALSLFVKSGKDKDQDKKPLANLPILIGSAIFAVIIWLSAAINGFKVPQFALAMGFVTALMIVGWRIRSLNLKILFGGLLSCFLSIGLASARADIMTLLAWGLPSMALFLGLATLILRRTSITTKNLYWAIAVPGIPLATFSAWPFTNFDLSDTVTGGLMAAVSLVFIALAFYHSHADRIWATRTHLVAGALAYALAIALYFTGFPVSLALMAGIGLTVLISTRLTSDSLAFIALGFACLVAAHVLFLELPTQGRISSQPIFNQLWIYLALPAGLSSVASVWLERHERTLATEGLKAFGLAFAAMFTVFQIRHLMNGGDLFANSLKFDELALQILTGLSLTLGGTLISVKGSREKLALHDRLIPTLAMFISGITLLAFVLGLCLVANPLFGLHTEIRGNHVLNSLTLAYLVPAILLAGIAWLSQSRRPAIYVRIAGGLALLGLLLFLTTQVRFMFSGADISLSSSSPKGLELYMISATWLALGVALLFAGLKSRRRDLRLASAIVVILSVLKAFLIDMAGLEGVLRAVAFVVLGIILIVIGRAYQRLLFSATDRVSE